MKFKPYPRYKDSGIEWLGDVPEDWEIKRLRFIAKYKNSNVDKKSYEDQLPVRLCNYTDVYYNEFIKNDMDFMVATASKAEIETMKLSCGNVIITKDSEASNDIGIPAIVCENLDNVVCGYHLTVISSENIDTNRFIHRAIQSDATKFYFFIMSPGITRFGLNQNTIGNIQIAFPSIQEQTAIANFLDRETRRIDALIEEKNRFIELLKEKRQALISHAVTKGLDPAVKMKDSGIEWLGEVPANWVVTKLGFITSKVGSGKTPKGGSEVYSEKGIIFIRSQNVYDTGLVLEDVVYINEEIDENMSGTRIKPGDVLLNVTGGSIGRTCLVPKDFPRANVNQHVCIIRLKSEKNRDYVSWYLKSNFSKTLINVYQNGAGREGLNFEQIANITVAIPLDTDEIDKVVIYISKETAKIDALITETQNSIALLKEHRAALISAAVTGKIDVREEK